MKSFLFSFFVHVSKILHFRCNYELHDINYNNALHICLIISCPWGKCLHNSIQNKGILWCRGSSCTDLCINLLHWSCRAVHICTDINALMQAYSNMTALAYHCGRMQLHYYTCMSLVQRCNDINWYIQLYYCIMYLYCCMIYTDINDYMHLYCCINK